MPARESYVSADTCFEKEALALLLGDPREEA